MEIRPVAPEDAAALREVRAQVYPHRPPLADADVAARLAPRERALHLLAWRDDRAVGYATASANRHALGRGGFHGHVAVIPEARGAGVGAALAAAVADWAEREGAAAIVARLEERDEDDGIAWALRRGFAVLERLERFEVAPADAAAAADRTPAGLTVEPLGDRDEVLSQLFGVVREAARDEPGEENVTLPHAEAWLEEQLAAASGRRDAILIARADGRVVGVALFVLHAGDATTAHHGFLGVARSWRRRGVATALRRAQIEWATAAGIRRLVTTADSRNAAMIRLNERFGYRRTPGAVVLRAALPLGPGRPSGRAQASGRGDTDSSPLAVTR